MIEKIFIGNNLAAILVRRDFKSTGIQFFTDTEFSQQLGYMSRPKGYIIEPHIHKDVSRQVTKTQEVLFIKSGKLLVEFYDNDKKFAKSRVLETGDIILLAECGHGFKMLEETEIFEVKQGPYAGEEDKMRFRGDNHE